MTEQTSSFQQAIEAIEALPFSDQEVLLSLLQKRFAERRRQELVQEVAEVRYELAQGNVTFGSADDFLAEMDD
jgi:hypothetical protein